MHFLRLAISLAALLVLSVPTGAQSMEEFGLVPGNIAESRFSEGEELILTLRIDNFVFGEVFAIKSADNVHVELDGLLTALNFPIYYDPQIQTYDGWYLNTSNTFSLKAPAQENIDIVLNPTAKSEIIDRSLYTRLDGVLYVSPILLDRWFDMPGSANLQDLVLLLEPRMNLPFQDKLKRKNQKIRNNNRDDVEFTELKRGFGLLSPQAIDLQVNSAYIEQADEVFGSYSLLGGRDVALFNTQFFLSGSKNDWLEIARLQLSKTDDERKLFGINNVGTLRVGDITPVRQANGSTAAQSRGLLIDNLAAFRDINLDASSIAGEIQIGWDVELYRNGILVGQQFEVQTGRFEFNDVPLDAGINTLRIVMYGPQGQVVERTEERILDRNTVTSNRLKYRVSLTQTGESLFNINRVGSESDRDLGYNFSANVQHRLFNNTALNVGVISQFGGELSSNLFTLSTNTALANKWILGTNIQADDDKTYRGALSARTGFLGQSLSASFGYSSVLPAPELERLTGLNAQIDLSGQFEFAKGINLSYRNEVALSENEGILNKEFRNSLGFTSKFINVYNNITMIEPELNDSQRFGSVSMQRAFGPVLVRVNSGYSFDDVLEFNDLRFDLGWSPFENMKARFGFNRNLINKSNTYELQTTWQHDAFSLTSVLRQADNVGFTFGLTARLSVGGAPLQYNSVFNTVVPVASKGTLLVRVFIDTNVNGIFEPGEVVIPGVTVRSVQSRREAQTNESGIAALTNLPIGRATDITLDYGSVEDPFLVPLVKGVSIRARDGSIDNLDFPMAPGNEIEGTAFKINDKNIKIPITRAPIELLDSSGKVKFTTESEFDGFYVFTGITAGRYTLRINPDFLERTRLKMPPPLPLRITNDIGLLSGVDVYLEDKEFMQGYVPAIGSFSNLQMTNLFWHRIKTKESFSVFTKTAFSIPVQDKVSVGLGLFESLEAAQQICTMLTQDVETCQVVPHAVEVRQKPTKTLADFRKDKR